MDNRLKARENAARRAAGRQGYRLWKHGRRDPRGLSHGAWRITEEATGAQVASFGWGERPDGTDHLAQVEAWLRGEPDAS